MTEEKMPVLNIDDPKDAKTFLQSIKVDCKSVTEVTLANGKTLAIEDMTDTQLVHYAKELYFDLFKAEEGKDCVIDTHIRTGAN